MADKPGALRVQGFPPVDGEDSVTIDPFHSNVLYAWAGSGGYVSQDAAASWHPSSLPWPSTVTVSGGLRFTFDPVTSRSDHHPVLATTSSQMLSGSHFRKASTEGRPGNYLNAPFNVCCVVADPKTTGVLYMIGSA